MSRHNDEAPRRALSRLAENQRLREELADTETEKIERGTENQRLRDALKRIGDDTDPLGGYRGAGDFARSILREALAGDAE